MKKKGDFDKYNVHFLHKIHKNDYFICICQKKAVILQSKLKKNNTKSLKRHIK